MAKKHFLIPATLTRRFPLLRNIGWRMEALMVKVLVRYLSTMSPERGARFAYRVFRALKPVFPFVAKIRANLALAFPDKSAAEIERLTREVCGNLGNAAAELIFAQRIWEERDERVEFVMAEGVDIEKYRDHPAVMMTGHIGAWQLALFVARAHGLQITSVYAPEENPYVREQLLQLRLTLQSEFLSRDGCMRGLMQQLRAGNLIGLAADAKLDGGDPIPFFGLPVPSNTTAARLAVRHECDFLPVLAERLPRMRFRITVGNAIHADDPDAPLDEQAKQMTRKLFEYFEAWIREMPGQWMCFANRWMAEVYEHKKAL